MPQTLVHQALYQPFQQTYRHFIQQQIVRQEMRSMRQSHAPGKVWELCGIMALFAAAAECGILAQVHWG